MGIRAHLAGAFLVALAVSVPAAVARPPELPGKQRVTCRPDSQEPAPDEKGNQADGGWFTDGPPASDVTCPFLRQKIASKAAASPPEIDLPETALENLLRLQEAANVYRKAEIYRRAGAMELASQYYKEVRRLCPGSRYDRAAQERLVHLLVKDSDNTDEGGAEAQEAPPSAQEIPNADGPSADAPADAAKEVADRLLRLAEEALEAGRFSDAADLAGCAQRLDPAADGPAILLLRNHLIRMRQATDR